MGFVVSFVLLFIAVVTHINHKTIAHPIVIFGYEWALIAFLASLRLYTLYEVSLKAWLMIFIGCLSFIFGACMGQKIIVSQRDISKKTFTKKQYYLICFIILIICIKNFLPTFALLRAGYSLTDIRLNSFDIISINGISSKSALDEYIEVFRAILEMFVVGYGIDSFVRDFKKNYFYVIPILVIVLLESFTSGGRFVLAYFMLKMVVCYSLYKKKGLFTRGRNAKKLKRSLFFVCIILFVAITIVGIMRGTDFWQLMAKYYRYICGNTVFFDYHIKRIDSIDFYSYSFAAIYGFWSLVLPVLHSFLGFPYPKVYLDTISTVMVGQVFVKIGENLSTNAFITSFYALYADFRLFGVVIGMICFGMICGYCYKCAINLRKPIYTIVYLFMAQMIFTSLHTFFLTSSSNFFSCLVIAYIFFRNHERNVTVQRRQ